MRETINAQDLAVPQVISPKAHGIIDYCHAAFFFTLGLEQQPRA